MKPRKNLLSHRVHAAAFAAAVLTTSTSAHAQSWDGGAAPSLSWNSANNWNPNTVPVWGNTIDLTFDLAASTQSFFGNAIPIVRSISVGPLVDTDFGATLRSQTTSGGTARNLTFSSSTGTASLTVDSGSSGLVTFGVATGHAPGGGAIVLTSNLNIVHNGTGELVFNRPLESSGSLTKTGTGTFRYAPTVTPTSYTGTINLNQGRSIFAAVNAVSNDFGGTALFNLGGGIMEIQTTTALDKVMSTNTTVSSASTLAYNNTTATNQSLTISTGSLLLNANLTLQNMSNVGTNNNLINLTRNITGSGALIVETTNNVASGAVDFSRGRVQLSGDNTAWTGSLVVAKGTAQFSGNNAFVPTPGSITLGTTGDAFGAALGFNQGNTDVNVTNAVTVTTGGVRLIRNNAGPGTAANITLNGAVNLQGSLTLDHAGLGAGKSITVSGKASGAGGLNVSFVGPHAVADSSVRLTAANDYTGATNVSSGTLVINGNQSLATGAVSVSGKLSGSGTVGGATTIHSGGTHNAGDPTVAGGVGSQAFSSSLNYANGSIFEWDLNANSTLSGYDTVSATGNIDVGTATVFKVVFGAGVDLGNSFWSSPSTTESWALTSIFGKAFNSGAFSSVVSTADPVTQGSFSITGTHLTWTAVPEPTSALAGLLITAGLLRRRRLGA